MLGRKETSRDAVREMAAESAEIDLDLREGRFQRWLALIAGLSSVLSGLEVSYEHYKGSYSQPIMYTPLALSGALLVAGVCGFFSKTIARKALPAVSAITLVDAATGFVLHVRGIRRKPGGWRLPIVNIVMGPPIFAPLLFGISAYLGVVASCLRRDDGNEPGFPKPGHAQHWLESVRGHEPIDEDQHIRERFFQRQLAAATVLAAFLSGFEAWYSHYKNNFRYWVQWTPLIVAPLLMAAGIGAIGNRRVAHTVLPATSAIAMLNGTIGFGFHVRGVLRRPGGAKKLLYNIAYGPPIFAPLLFSASGFLGILASVLGGKEK